MTSGTGKAHYPVEALKRHEQGRVTMELTVGKDGIVSQCQILKSSNSASLDKESCGTALRQMHYTAAKDASGNLIASKTRLSINWVLPR